MVLDISGWFLVVLVGFLVVLGSSWKLLVVFGGSWWFLVVLNDF